MSEDLIIGSLRCSIRGLQELMQYLEGRHGLGGDDAVYCQQKVKEAVRQLKVFQRLVSEHAPVKTFTPQLFWN